MVTQQNTVNTLKSIIFLKITKNKTNQSLLKGANKLTQNFKNLFIFMFSTTLPDFLKKVKFVEI